MDHDDHTDKPRPDDDRRHRRITRSALHPLGHVISLIGLHIMALLVIDKTPLLSLLWLH